MKRLICALIFICLLLSSALAMETDARAAILIEQSTGRVLYEKNAREQLPMASTTKIATALTAIQHGNLQDIVTIDISSVGIEGSSIYLEEGETMTLEDLLYGLMLRSGNDAADAIARHVGQGERQAFIDLMNLDAAQLGLRDTAFQNPHGLPAEEHYTTAYDLALITRQAYNYDVFREIVSTYRKVIPWDGHEYDRAMLNKNKLLTGYEGANGVKTGFTKAAGRCLVSAAERDGMQLIAVVLNCPDMWNESSELLDFGFANFEMMEIMRAGTPIAGIAVEGSDETVELESGEDVRVPIGLDEAVKIGLNVDEGLKAPIAKGQTLGYARVEIEGDTLLTFPLVASNEVLDGKGRFLKGLWDILLFWK